VTSTNYNYINLMEPENQTINAKSPKETVMSFIKGLNDKDFKAAREYVTDDMRFIGVLVSSDGADVYFDNIRHMKFKYNIKEAFEEGNEVCLFYDVDMGGKTIFCCGWYLVKDGKINSMKGSLVPGHSLKKATKNRIAPVRNLRQFIQRNKSVCSRFIFSLMYPNKINAA
jgi:hypothetical protein